MKQFACSLVVAVAAAATLVVPAVAAPGDVPSRTPTLTGYSTTVVVPRVKYVIACLDFETFQSGAAPVSMLAWSLTDMKGRRVSASFTVFDDLANAYVTASVGPVNQSHIAQRYASPEGEWTVFYVTPKVRGTFRLGWAQWGSRERCLLVRDGTFAVARLSILKSARARYALATDFAGPGPAIGTSKGGLAVARTLTRASKGYVFAVFRPGVDGVAKVTDPKGKVRYDSVAKIGDGLFAEKTSGNWTYELTAQKTDDGGPILWVMELPA